jgi:hypothetical protein
MCSALESLLSIIRFEDGFGMRMAPDRPKALRAIQRFHHRRILMLFSKNPKAALSALTLAITIGASAAGAYAGDNRVANVPEQEGSYCHMQFPAMQSRTLASSHPQLKSAQSGDVIDYYGACDHNPQGRDEVISQRHDEERRWQNDYES